MKKILVASTLALALVIAGFFAMSPASAMEGQVVRVVDGDTVVVRADDDTLRVRILNIDTPETVDPSRKPQCLGQQASEFTKDLLAPGTRVKLTFDKEREDKYGRTLAKVQLSDGRSVATEIARAGLGVPIVVGENRAGYSEVKRALIAADRAKRGYFDPTEKCTFPAHERALRTDLKAAEEISGGTTIADAAAAATAAYALVNVHQAYADGIWSTTSFPIRAMRAVGSAALIADYQTEFESIRQIADDFATDKTNREDAEARRIRELEAARAAAERARQQAAERARQQAAERARQQAANEAAERTREQADDDDDDGGSGGGSSGDSNRAPCRRYAPGGKTWTPMPCP